MCVLCVDYCHLWHLTCCNLLSVFRILNIAKNSSCQPAPECPVPEFSEVMGDFQFGISSQQRLLHHGKVRGSEIVLVCKKVFLIQQNKDAFLTNKNMYYKRVHL